MYGLLLRGTDSQYPRFTADCSPDYRVGTAEKAGKVHRFEQEVQELQKRLEIASLRLYKPLSKEMK